MKSDADFCYLGLMQLDRAISFEIVKKYICIKSIF
jgi:hypothetical protein